MTIRIDGARGASGSRLFTSEIASRAVALFRSASSAAAPAGHQQPPQAARAATHQGARRLHVGSNICERSAWESNTRRRTMSPPGTGAPATARIVSGSDPTPARPVRPAGSSRLCVLGAGNVQRPRSDTGSCWTTTGRSTWSTYRILPTPSSAESRYQGVQSSAAIFLHAGGWILPEVLDELAGWGPGSAVPDRRPGRVRGRTSAARTGAAPATGLPV